MEIPPDVNDTTVLEKMFKRGRAVTRGGGQATPSTIQKTVKNFVKVPTKNCGDRGINLGMKLVKELIPRRVAVRSVHTNDTKGLAKEGKFNL